MLWLVPVFPLTLMLTDPKSVKKRHNVEVDGDFCNLLIQYHKFCVLHTPQSLSRVFNLFFRVLTMYDKVFMSIFGIPLELNPKTNCKKLFRNISYFLFIQTELKVRLL